MQHTIEELIRRINLMHDKAIELHRLRNQYSNLAIDTYDKAYCKAILEDIQGIALLIANDKQGDEIKTEMDEWKKDTMVAPVFEKGYPSWEAVNQERYYEYMLRKSKEVKDSDESTSKMNG